MTITCSLCAFECESTDAAAALGHVSSVHAGDMMRVGLCTGAVLPSVVFDCRDRSDRAEYHGQILGSVMLAKKLLRDGLPVPSSPPEEVRQSSRGHRARRA